MLLSEPQESGISAPPGSEVTIRQFQPGDEAAFKSLNEEWIIKYFRLEPKDELSLTHPRETILDRGGKILFAVVDRKCVGCCALVRIADNEFEVAKMAGWLVAPVRAEHVAFGSVLGADRKMLKTRSGENIKLIELNGGGFTNLGAFALNGKPLGVLEGNYTQVDPKSGKKIVDANGYYLSSSDIGIIGDPTPKYKLTGISTLSWRYLSFRIQVDYTRGGQLWSNTVRTMLARGVTKDTDFDRSIPLTLPNTVKQDGTPNNILQSVDNIYFNSYGFGPAGEQIWNATIFRIREAALTFNVPQKILKNTPFGSASFDVSGSNLFYVAPYFPKHTRFDPEINSLGVTNAKGLDFFAGPSSRRLGASLKLSF